MSARRSRGHPIHKATSRPVSAAASGQQVLLTSRCEFINGRQKKEKKKEGERERACVSSRPLREKQL